MNEERWADIVYSEAVGEKVSPDDEAFKQAELAADPACVAEESALAALRAGLAGAAPRSEDATFARQSVKRANDRHRRARQMVWTGAGVLAAAASIAIAVRMRPANAPSGVASNAPAAIDSHGGCVHASSTAAACFDIGSKLDAPTGSGDLHLVRGHIVAALKPLPAGSEFSITTPHGKATVVGTQFAVDVSPDGTRTEVRVIKGKVRVDNASTGAQAFVEKGHFAILGEHLETGSLTEPTPDRDRALLALAKHEAGITDDADESVDDAAKSPEGPSSEAPKARHLEKGGSPPATPATAGELLEEARRLRAGGQYEPSAEVYRRLMQRHPESPEARAAIVSLGQLELSQLGHPEAALHWFEKYLTSTGQLRQEAAYGKIQALQRLGRSAQERREIARFLQEFPKSAQSSALRSRLDSLGPEPH
jgi:ferric-dicitrate binding protein FerR (iron transport regulator)